MGNLNTKEIVRKYDFKFTKSLGQNFLKDESVLKDIVDSSNVTKDDLVIEIGPGVGTLTKELLEKAKKVCAIELDSTLIPILEKELEDYDNFQLINKDALKIDFNEIIEDEKNVKFIANLPYYVTTPIIAKILKEVKSFDLLTIMIQKEVAQRIAAKPSTKEYGSLTILVQYYCDVEIIATVPSTSFIPSPKVDSMVIQLKKLPKTRAKVIDEVLFMKIVRQSFNLRRKTLRNVIKSLNLIEVDDIEKLFEEANIEIKRRGETLSIEEFGRLSDTLYKFINKK
ncbi:16S rRNA (adenine(1518)-N(6)/adenine(1519)-N(6))-dimethyltransferase RsmA [Clostridium sp. DL1XJH146]